MFLPGSGGNDAGYDYSDAGNDYSDGGEEAGEVMIEFTYIGGGVDFRHFWGEWGSIGKKIMIKERQRNILTFFPSLRGHMSFRGHMSYH